MTTLALRCAGRRAPRARHCRLRRARLRVASQIAIPLPWTPVPLTLQPMLVVLAGMLLGPVARRASMVLVSRRRRGRASRVHADRCAGHRALLRPDGRLSPRVSGGGVRRGFAAHARRFGGALARGDRGHRVIFIGGIAQLGAHRQPRARVQLGVTPFAALDVVKAFIAAAISGPRRRRRGSERDARRLSSDAGRFARPGGSLLSRWRRSSCCSSPTRSLGPLIAFRCSARSAFARRSAHETGFKCSRCSSRRRSAALDRQASLARVVAGSGAPRARAVRLGFRARRAGDRGSRRCV